MPDDLEECTTLESGGAGLDYWPLAHHSAINILTIKWDYSLISNCLLQALKIMQYGDWFRIGIL